MVLLVMMMVVVTDENDDDNDDSGEKRGKGRGGNNDDNDFDKVEKTYQCHQIIIIMAELRNEMEQKLPLIFVHLENVFEVVQPDLTLCSRADAAFGLGLVHPLQRKVEWASVKIRRLL